MGIDGYLILELEDDDIRNELKIKNNLHVKKILKAIVKLKKYSEYFKQVCS